MVVEVGTSGGERRRVELAASPSGGITMQTLGVLERGHALWGGKLNVL